MLRMTPAEKVSRTSNQSKYVYPGAAWDCEVLGQIVCQKHTGGAVMMPPVIFDVIAGVLFLCDLPLSFVADTICLPYDCYMVTFGGYERDGSEEYREEE